MVATVARLSWLGEPDHGEQQQQPDGHQRNGQAGGPDLGQRTDPGGQVADRAGGDPGALGGSGGGATGVAAAQQQAEQQDREQDDRGDRLLVDVPADQLIQDPQAHTGDEGARQ